MNCQTCDIDLTNETVKIEANLAAHDDNVIDIIVTCENCGTKYNAFVEMADLVKIDNNNY